MLEYKWAEFKDPQLEEEYYNTEVKSALSYFIAIVMTLGVLYFLFIIPDSYNLADRRLVTYVFINRATFLLLITAFCFFLKKIKRYKYAAYLITVYMFLFVLSYLHIVSLYPDPNYLIKCFDIIVITLGFFLVPNLWRLKVIAALFLAVAFLVFAYYRMDVSGWSFAAGAVYIFIVMLMSAAWSYRVEYYKRQHYADLRELQRVVVTDLLTGAYNRGKFITEMEKNLAAYKKAQVDFSLILFDIDDFKAVNDRYGHLTGDKVLKEFVRVIQKNVRATDVLVRWGGEEFVLLLPGTSNTQAVEVANKIQNLVRNHDFGIRETITCSYGIVSAKEGATIEALFAKVDSMMYRAKKQRKK
ncbi:MAG: GGDEF domain-containing protein [Firmicutes bacterium]|nr:GGDEF domain-containing protein [Bacillota bacterium]